MLPREVQNRSIFVPKVSIFGVGLFGASRSRFWSLSGSSWSRFGGVWRRLEAVSGGLGASGAAPGRFGAEVKSPLRRFGAAPGRFGANVFDFVGVSCVYKSVMDTIRKQVTPN